MSYASRFRSAGLLPVVLAAFLCVASSAHAMRDEPLHPGSMPAAHSLTLDEQRQYDKWVEDIKTNGHSDTVRKQCGVNIPVRLDPAFATPYMQANIEAGGVCDEALAQIATECLDENGKKAILGKIKSVSCIYQNAKDEPSSLRLAEGGELQYSVGTNPTNEGEKIKKFLDSNL